MQQWKASLKRPDLSEYDRVRGAIEACLRQAFAIQLLDELDGVTSFRPTPPPIAAEFTGRATCKEDFSIGDYMHFEGTHRNSLLVRGVKHGRAATAIERLAAGSTVDLLRGESGEIFARAAVPGGAAA